MEEIIEWLNSNKGSATDEQQFGKGAALYARHGKMKRNIRLFSKGYNSLKAKKLYRELYAIAEKLQSEKETAANAGGGEETEGTGATEHQGLKAVNDLIAIALPDELKALHYKKGRLYNRACKARRELYEMHFGEKQVDSTESFGLVKTAVDNMLENNLIWKEIRHYTKTDEMLNEHPSLAENKKVKELEALNPLELQRRLQNLPTYISKARKYIRENPGSEKLAEKEEKIKEHEREIALIENLLNT